MSSASTAVSDQSGDGKIGSHQIKSGVAAWLGWMFDGLDMHLYTLVALPFVAELMGLTDTDQAVREKASYIQAAFLAGWALGGGLFGLVGDRLGRTRALILTILTYALFTGLSFFAQSWWQLMAFRFLAALGIGGEWAVGASLLSETWPAKWRPWLAAILQTGVNIGVLFANLAGFLLSSYPNRTVFLVGVIPALLVLWIRKEVPEPDAWEQAKETARPRIADLFRGNLLRTTLVTLLVCSFSLSGHWAFMFWSTQQVGRLQIETMQKAESPPSDEEIRMAGKQMTNKGLSVLMFSSIAGNFVAAVLARFLGYRWAILLLCAVYGVLLFMAYSVVRLPGDMLWWFVPLGICQGVFGLFTMYMPPLFPTLLRTTGAGFCYNIGRLAAAGATIVLVFLPVPDLRHALLWTGGPLLAAAMVGLMLPEHGTERQTA